MCAGGGGSQSAILDMGSEMAVHRRDESEGCRPRPGVGAAEAMGIWVFDCSAVWRGTQACLWWGWVGLGERGGG